MNEGDNALYGDIELAAKDVEISQLKGVIEKLTTEKETLRNEMNQLKAHLASLMNEKEIMEKNIVTIFNTAIREIKRKEKEIATLRSSSSSER